MKNIFLGIITILIVWGCQQEPKKTAATSVPGYQEMQQVAGDIDTKLSTLTQYQGAIRDMLHSFEASFPKDTFTTKLRFQLSELNKVEYSYNVWKKSYGGLWDTLKVQDKATHAVRGKADALAVKDALSYNIESSKKLIQLLKDRQITVTNDPTIQK
jgi:hypothetical protein